MKHKFLFRLKKQLTIDLELALQQPSRLKERRKVKSLKSSDLL